MGIEEWIVRLLLGGIIGFCIGLTGIGGGVLVMPALTVVLGLSASNAVGTASLYAFLTKIYASYQHLKLKTVDVKSALLLLTGAVPGNIIAAKAITLVVNRLAGTGEGARVFQDNLKNFIAFVVLLSALILIFDIIKKKRNESLANHVTFAARINRKPLLRRFLIVLTGVLIGALIGATSVGGGVLLIPALIIVFGMTSNKTVGTSIFVAVVLTLLTALVYGQGGQLDWQTAVSMAAGSIAGVYGGSRLCAHLPEEKLRIVVIAIVLVSAITMLASPAAH
jgi:uncharacterized membrane protein YfcA